MHQENNHELVQIKTPNVPPFHVSRFSNLIRAAKWRSSKLAESAWFPRLWSRPTHWEGICQDFGKGLFFIAEKSRKGVFFSRLLLFSDWEGEDDLVQLQTGTSCIRQWSLGHSQVKPLWQESMLTGLSKWAGQRRILMQTLRAAIVLRWVLIRDSDWQCKCLLRKSNACYENQTLATKIKCLLRKSNACYENKTLATTMQMLVTKIKRSNLQLIWATIWSWGLLVNLSISGKRAAGSKIFYYKHLNFGQRFCHIFSFCANAFR